MSTAWTRSFLRWIRSPRRRPIRRAPVLRPKMERLESRETPAVFFGGVRIASADVTGDSVADIVTAAGPGGGPHVRVMNGATGKDSLNFFAYDQNFSGGVFVAAGDVTGDGLADIVTGTDQGGVPQVKVFDGRSGQMISSFFAFPTAFTGGVRVAVGDVNGDGRGDIICAAGPGGLPVVSVYTSDGTLESSFNAYDPAFAGGVFVGTGDINGDGRPEIITGAGSGGAPHVKIFNASGQLQNSFFAFDVAFTGGVTVAAGHYTSATHDDIIVGAGFGGVPVVRIFNGTTLQSSKDFLAYDQRFNGGVFVAAPHFGTGSTDDILTGAGFGGGPHVRGLDGQTLTEITGFMAYAPFGGSDTPFAHPGTPPTPDTIAPTISITTPQPTSPVSTNQTIVGTIVDDRAGVLTVTAQVDSGSVQTLTVANGNFSFTTGLSLTGSADGPHTVTFHGNDAANNQAVPQTFTFTLQAAPSQVTLDLAPENDGAVTGNHRTNDATVALVGTAPANSTVALVNTAFTTTADATGHFRFSAVPLALGVNSFTARATPAGGSTPVSFTRQIVRNSAPEVAGAVAPFHVDAGAQATIMNMPSIFSDVDVSTLIHFDTNMGGFDVELFDQQTPQTVANLISYITSGAYANSIFHRTVSDFVIQGGGFDFHTNPNRLDSITTNAAVQNEPGISNQLGTIAMAKLGGDPNSATSQFFFNLTDNSRGNPMLDTQNGGFTAFGQVRGDGMTIVNALAAIPTQDRGGVFTDIPLQNYPAPPAGNFPTDTSPANYAFINGVSVTRQHDANNMDSLTYSIVSNSNPNLVSASLSGAQLSLNYAAGQSGGATITLRAVDSEGSIVESTFTVNVGTVADDSTAPTVTITDPPQNQTTSQNVTIHGTAIDAVSGLFSLTASIDGHAAVPVTVAANGSFSFATTLATDGTQDGAHTVAFIARDQAGNVSGPVNFQFTLDSGVAQLSLDLDQSSDTAGNGVAGNHRTTLDNVTLTGVADPGVTVSLTGTNFTTTADAQGAYSFANVPLAVGVNTFTAHAVDTAGNHRDFTRIIVRDSDPTVASPVQAFQVDASAAPTFLNLPNIFSDADVSSLVRFTTAAGTFDLELFDQQSPLTVANFLNYISSGKYTNSIFHRSIHDFVLQGGGFQFAAGAPSQLNAIVTDPAVMNEPGISNLLGTIAMAKIDGDPNSATSQFFFNLTDNSRGQAALDTQNGGFTAFGQLRGNGLTVVQALASLNTQNRGGDFTDIPLENYPQPPAGSFPGDTTAANFALISDISIIRRSSADNADGLTYSIVSNSNPNLVTPTIVGGKLTLVYAAAQNGRARITVRATDTEGRSVDTTFSVTVGTVAADTSPPTLTINDPNTGATLTNNVVVHGHVSDTDSGVQTLTASTDGGPSVNVPFLNDGSFSFLTQFLFDGAHDGPHKVTFTARDFAGNTSLIAELDATIHTVAGKLTFDLDTASDTSGGGIAGNHRTIMPSVTLTGTTDANASVSLLGTGRSTTADGQGHFSFENVPLAVGVNLISVQSTSGGTTAEFDRLIIRDSDPTVASALQNFRVQIGSGPTVFNLPSIFSDADTSSLVEFATSAGTFDVELFDQFAPNAVGSFLSDVSSGRYNSTIFDSATAGSALQGGRFQYVYNPNGLNHLDPVVAGAQIADEAGLSNLAGTLAAAQVPGQTNNSASQFRFNVSDNPVNDTVNGGLTVFGQLRGTGLQTVTNLAAIPTQDRGGAFSHIPMQNYPQPPNGNFPGDTKPANYAFLNSATVLRQVDARNGDALTYTVTSNTNTNLVTASIVDGKLTLTYTAAMAGNATITLRATDAEGRFVETHFTVNVGVIALP